MFISLWFWCFHIHIGFCRDFSLSVKQVNNILSLMFSRFQNNDFWQKKIFRKNWHKKISGKIDTFSDFWWYPKCVNLSGTTVLRWSSWQKIRNKAQLDTCNLSGDLCESKNFHQGSYVCKCNDGFLLAAKQDKKTHKFQDCTNIDECVEGTG